MGGRKVHGEMLPFMGFNERHEHIQAVALIGVLSCEHQALVFTKGRLMVRFGSNRFDVGGMVATEP